MPSSKLFLRIASGAGVAAVLAMEAGWVVTEVGRQPWVVRGHMKVEDAATTNEGVWITFIAVVVLYVALATTVVLVLRSMSRRFREQDDGSSTTTSLRAARAPRRARARAGAGADRWMTPSPSC